MLPANGIYMAPANQATPRGVQRIDILAAVRSQPPVHLADVAKAVRKPQPSPPAVEEPSMTLDFDKLKPATLQALYDDRNVPEEMKKLAKQALDARAERAVDGDEAVTDQAIAASHRAGGFNAWLDRKLAK